MMSIGALPDLARRWLPPFLVVTGCAGCALPTIPTKVAELDLEIPRKATPVALQASLDTLEDARTKRQIQRMLESPETRAMQREIVGGLLDGSLAALGDKDRAERISALTAKYATAMIHRFSTNAAEELGPAAAAAMRGAVRGAVEEALRADKQGDVRRMVAGLARDGAQEIAQGLREAKVASAMSEAMTSELGPALHKMLQEDIGPGIAGALANEDVRRELGATTRVMGRELVLGASDAMKANEESQRSDKSSLGERIGLLASRGTKLVNTGILVLGALIVVLAAWLLKLIFQTRRYRRESEQRAAAIHLLDAARQASAGKPWSGELITTLEEQIHAEEEALRHLQEKRRWHLRHPHNGAGASSPS